MTATGRTPHAARWASIEWLFISFALGVFIAQQCAQIVPHASLGLTLALGCAVALKRLVGPRTTLFVSLPVFVVAAGFFYAQTRAQLRLNDALPNALEGTPLVVEGVIATLPGMNERGVRFVFEVESVRAPANASVPARLSITWTQALKGDEVPRVHAGERWRLAVRLRQPHGFANPHGFDLEAWLLERGIRATGAVSVHDAANERLSADAGRWQDRIERWRERSRDRIRAALGEARWAGVVVAMAIGDQGSVTAADWNTFTAAGISHLLSISGAHVTLFAAAISLLVFNGWRRHYRLTLAIPARKAAILASVVATIAYALFSGFAVPAQRTCFMLMIVALAFWRNTRWRPSLVLAAALAVVLLLDPWAVMSPGFWFSYGAVACLLWVSAYRVGATVWWRRALIAQLAVFVAVLPIALALFQQVSLAGIVVNMVAIPLVSFVVVPLALLGMLLPASGLLQLAHDAFELLAPLCTWVSTLPLATWQQHAPPAWTVGLACFGAFCLIGPRQMPGKWFAVMLMIPLFAVKPIRPAEGTFTVTALDVGQGLAVVVQTQSYDLLYDAGPKWTDDTDAGQRIVVPYLRATGARLGAMVISHQDSDHAGGAASVLRERPPDWSLSSFSAGSDQRCVAGQRWNWDGVQFEVVHPQIAHYDQPARKSNDLSCVIRVVGLDGASALLTGDVEALAEAELVDSKRSLRSALLTMPHHGSLTSSTPAFIDAVAPDVVVVNAGYRNRFAHPRPEVIDRYRQRRVRVDRTDFDGAVTYRWSAQGWQARRWREDHGNYWRHQPNTADPPLQ